MTGTLDRFIEEFLRGLIIAEVPDHIQVVTSLMGEGEATATLPRIVIECQSQETPDFKEVGVHRIITQISSIAEATSSVSSDDLQQMNEAVDRVIVFADNLPAYLTSQDVVTHGVNYGGEVQQTQGNKLIRVRSAEIWSRLLNAAPLVSQVPVVSPSDPITVLNVPSGYTNTDRLVTIGDLNLSTALLRLDAGSRVSIFTQPVGSASDIDLSFTPKGTASAVQFTESTFATGFGITGTTYPGAPGLIPPGPGITFFLNGSFYTVTAQGFSLLDDATAAAQRVTLGLVIGVDVLSPTGDGSGLTGLAGARLPRGYLFGLGLGNNATDVINDIDVAVGTCRDSTDAADITLAGVITKRLDAAWVVGTNQGGLDTGAIADTTYHVWLIKRSDTGVVDVLFSTSATAPTMPANYNYKRRLGSILRISAAIKPFIQFGDVFRFLTNIQDVTATNPGTSAVTVTLSVPIGIEVMPDIFMSIAPATSGTISALVTSLNETDRAASSTDRNIWVGSATTARGGGILTTLKTNTSAQIRYRISASGASDAITINTFGWTDNRGRNN